MSTSTPNISINGVTTAGIPDYPSIASIKSLKTSEVPLPAFYNLAWTEPPEKIFRPSFPEHISLPDPQENPALYQAAIETIRTTNAYFVIHAPYAEPSPRPPKDLVERIAKRWRKAFPDEDKFPMPPDQRTLLARPIDMRPEETHIGGRRLWTFACKRILKMDWDTKWKYLTASYKEIVKEEEMRWEKYNEMMIRCFIRYLVQRDYTIIKQTSPDQQPTPAELDEFFSREGNQDGLFLADIHRQHPGVKNVLELIRRVERFATLTPASCTDECQEPLYVRKRIPLRAEIQRILAFKPLSIPELLDWYPDGVGSEQAVVDILKAIAEPDVTTGRWVLKTQKGPDAVAIWKAMREDGLYEEEVMAMFPDQIRDSEEFIDQMSRVAYQESDTGLWLRCLLEGKRVLDETTSRKIRALRVWLATDAVSVLEAVEKCVQWDDGAEWFVNKPTAPAPKRRRDVEGEGDEKSSTEAGSSKRPIKKARTHASRCAYPQQY
ncbi:hypothetical protein K458DRAFT_399637 [Lentithecium fluviatile CBS 122367]|uniref:Uncharacterized protein n=1 Tax=Lentithecium fluviatile CBS 122367 TaxID=1168545 RepID=A0A6G1JJG3_9PLEO|nr:hypothetical protein K458DRAFT_399637 [Lentithecium fluviatile CBS 122367]